ncbi:hypothetical protein [Psychrobacillus phage Perkons]|nr:hypothetical protein [Psychrobacillus phage Perkons]
MEFIEVLERELKKNIKVNDCKENLHNRLTIQSLAFCDLNLHNKLIKLKSYNDKCYN